MDRTRIGLLGIPFNLGQPLKGVEQTPRAIREESDFLEEILRRNGNLRDFGDLSLESTIPLASRQISRAVHRVARQVDLSLLIGGDHGFSYGSIVGMKSLYPDLKILWVDAHGDINSPATSPTGNFHGMPLWELINQKILSPKDLILVGLRDLDLGEQRYLREKKIQFFSSYDVHRLGMEFIFSVISDRFGNHPVHLSFDVDAVDPTEIPSTGTVVPNGLSTQDMEQLFCFLQTMNLRSIDLAELNLALANSETQRRHCLHLTSELLLNLIPTRTSKRAQSPLPASPHYLRCSS